MKKVKNMYIVRDKDLSCRGVCKSKNDAYQMVLALFGGDKSSFIVKKEEGLTRFKGKGGLLYTVSKRHMGTRSSGVVKLKKIHTK